jgi:DNA-binding response OmpR family regulator
LDNSSILVVEDDQTIGMGLATALEHERFAVQWVDSAEKALDVLQKKLPDLIISDIMLPGLDGVSMMRQVKSEHPGLPLILLTAKTEEIDRVMGLEMGADDYVTKPFSVREVVARVKARLRDRAPTSSAPEIFRFGNVKVDLRRRLLWKSGEEARLTTHEAGTLAFLISHRGKDVSRDDLLQNVWGYAAALTTRTVDNQILKLRKKIEDVPSQPRHILTIHGTGYRFES